MESADLSSGSHPDDDDALETLLRRPLAPIPDDGFTRRIISALPPAAALRSSGRFRNLSIALGALAGITFVALRVDPISAFDGDWMPMLASLNQTTATLSEPALLLALATAGISLCYAFGIMRARP